MSETLEDPVEQGVTTIKRLQSRLAAVSENTLETLEEKGAIDVGDPYILVDVQVTCRVCGRQYEIGELIESGGCECKAE